MLSFLQSQYPTNKLKKIPSLSIIKIKAYKIKEGENERTHLRYIVGRMISNVVGCIEMCDGMMMLQILLETEN